MLWVGEGRVLAMEAQMYSSRHSAARFLQRITVMVMGLALDCRSLSRRPALATLDRTKFIATAFHSLAPRRRLVYTLRAWPARSPCLLRSHHISRTSRTGGHVQMRRLRQGLQDPDVTHAACPQPCLITRSTRLPNLRSRLRAPRYLESPREQRPLLCVYCGESENTYGV